MRLLLCGAAAPRLSVVTPAYNEAQRLPPTLESSLRFLAAERSSGWEVIVVDDGSDDQTAAAVRQHGLDQRLRLLRAPSNHGKGAALVRHRSHKPMLTHSPPPCCTLRSPRARAQSSSALVCPGARRRASARPAASACC